MKYAILQIIDHAATLSIWEERQQLKVEPTLILDETWFTETKILWKQYLAKLGAQDVQALFVKTNRPSVYVASRYELPNRAFFLQQYLQELTPIPVIDGMPDKQMTIHEYVQTQIEKYTWFVRYYGFTPGQKEKAKETMLSIGNGYLALRGALVESKSSASHYPGFYLTRGHNRLKTTVGSQIISNEDLVNWLNFQFFTLQIDGEAPIEPNEKNIKEMIRELDLRNGVYRSRMILDCGDKRLVEIVSRKVANMENYHQLALSYTITPLNFNGKMSIISAVDTTIKNEGVQRYTNLSAEHVRIDVAKIQEDFINVILETTHSKIKMQASVMVTSQREPEMVHLNEEKLEHQFVYRLQDGESATVEKIVDIRSSLDRQTLSEQPNIRGLEHWTFAKVVAASAQAWKKIWQQSDIILIGDIPTQQLLRVNSYHLFICASPFTAMKQFDAAISTTGIQGEGNRGHVFWDELFIMPFYLRTFPSIAKQMLLYRYRRLDKAQSYAQAHGYKGAMYPWESGAAGSEESQTLRFNPVSQKWGANYNMLQRHVSLAIAYNTIMYLKMTGDRKFVEDYAGKMLWEIALFWSSIATRDEKTGRYSIKDVMGPDSFHEKYANAREGGITDNAYINLMVIWFFRELPKVYAMLDQEDSQRLFKKIGYNMSDYQRMQAVAHMLSLDIDDGIIAQYRGYLDLLEIDLEKYKAKYGDIQRMDRILRAERKNTEEYQVIEQADMLLTFYNLPSKQVEQLIKSLGYEVGAYYLERNLLYYLRRTSHGSTNSSVVHAYLAEVAGMKELAWEFYQAGLATDYHDLQESSTAEGIHANAMAASISGTLLTYAGFDYRGEVITLKPNLPAHWQSIRFKWVVQAALITCEITQDTIKITSSDNVLINISGLDKTLQPDVVYRFQYAETVADIAS